jgi:hypothetical protein
MSIVHRTLPGPIEKYVWDKTIGNWIPFERFI